jgi:L-asparaginase II
LTLPFGSTHHLQAQRHRNGVVEAQTNVHVLRYHVARRHVLWQTANAAQQVVLLRSCFKPLQATLWLNALVQQGLPLPPSQAMALACASHSGQAVHQQWVAYLLQQAGLHSKALQCGAHWPLHAPTALPLQAQQAPACSLHHNCSGNHAALLWTCQLNGWPTAGYTHPSHPLQQALSQALQGYLGPAFHPVAWATDGCTLPTPALRLEALAHAYAEWLEDALLAHPLRQAMAAHPLLVAGEGRLDTQLPTLSGGQLGSKVGAEGLVVVWHPAQQELVLLKAEDGQAQSREKTLAQVLLALGWLAFEPTHALLSTAVDDPYCTYPAQWAWRWY